MRLNRQLTVLLALACTGCSGLNRLMGNESKEQPAPTYMEQAFEGAIPADDFLYAYADAGKADHVKAWLDGEEVQVYVEKQDSGSTFVWWTSDAARFINVGQHKTWKVSFYFLQ